MSRTAGAMVAGAALLVLVGAGCGDDDSGGGGTSLEATATEFQFEPNEWTVDAGDFTLEFTNDGTTTHEWVIMNEEISSEDEFAEDKVLDEVEAEEGDTVSQTFTVDEPGTYQVLCGLPGHFDEGMEGTLTVN